LPIATSTSEALGSSVNGLACCISVYVTPLTLCTFFHLFKILWGSASRLPLSSYTSLVVGWNPFLNSFMPLYSSLMFLFLLFDSGSLILTFPCCWNAC
jgi:hypothetical protein